MFLYFLFSAISSYNGGAGIFHLAARDSPSNRTLFGIVWTCLSTIILCAWTTVHPNVPPKNKPLLGLLHRLQVMFWMVIAPELVLAWAIRQRYAATDIRDTYNKYKGESISNPWTRVQGHLLGMGGFTLVDPDLKMAKSKDKKGQVLTYAQFEQLIQKPEFEFIDVTEEDVKDRSKNDLLSKLLAILQTTWFIIQGAARAQQKLSLTELELVTLALASLNAITFWAWWHKPLGVQEPVRIYMRTESTNTEDDDQQVAEQEQNCISFREVFRKGWDFIGAAARTTLGIIREPCQDDPFLWLLAGVVLVIFIITFPIFLLMALAIISLLRIIQLMQPVTQVETVQSRGILAAQIIAAMQGLYYSLSSGVGGFVGRKLKNIFDTQAHTGEPLDLLNMIFFGWFFPLPVLLSFLISFIILFTPFLMLLFLVSFIFTSAFGIVTTSTVCPGASYVPSFYAATTYSDRWSRMVVFVSFGAIFGGIHCFGWFLDYPTYAEQNLWRATSLAITVIPVIVAPIDYLLSTRLRDHDIKSCQRFERVALLALDFIMTVLLFIYVPARISLLAQALALLRHQPQSALAPVEWTAYIPHLFSFSS